LRAFWPRNLTGPFREPLRGSALTKKSSIVLEHQRLALTGSAEAVVLLKKRESSSPPDERKFKTARVTPNGGLHIAVMPRAIPQWSILEGIRTRAGKTSKVLYAEGCKITTGKQDGPDGMRTTRNWPPPESQAASIRAAVETARKADVAILVVGETESTNREAWSELTWATATPSSFSARRTISSRRSWKPASRPSYS